jgi:hypothetical protein
MPPPFEAAQVSTLHCQVPTRAIYLSVARARSHLNALHARAHARTHAHTHYAGSTSWQRHNWLGFWGADRQRNCPTALLIKGSTSWQWHSWLGFSGADQQRSCPTVLVTKGSFPWPKLACPTALLTWAHGNTAHLADPPDGHRNTRQQHLRASSICAAACDMPPHGHLGRVLLRWME